MRIIVRQSPSMGLSMPFILISLFIGLLVSCVGCQSEPPSTSSLPGPALMPFIQIPHDVQRIAVLHPKPTSPDLAYAYNWLERATFQLKIRRPELRIVDRDHLPELFQERRFQLAGSVAEDSAIRIGRVLGVDSVLIYRIDGPSVRDRMWAQSPRDLPPVTVTSKLIRVESAEVLYHGIVVARIEDTDSWGRSLVDSVDFHRLNREALDRGIAQAVLELGQVFE